MWGFLSGFLIALFPVILLLYVFRGRVLGMERPWLKGAVFGFLVWLLSWLIVYIDLVYEPFGFMSNESGPAVLALVSSSHYGFITCGLVVGFLSEKLVPGGGSGSGK